MDENEVKVDINLTINEVNVILRSLAKHPFEEIAALIAKIKSQGDAQLAELQANQNTADTTDTKGESDV